MEAKAYSGTQQFKGIQGEVSWQSPSNIALTKYWGKHGHQLPRNPSISFTLDRAHTQTSVEFKARESASSRVELDFYFEGEKNQAFAQRIQNFLEKNKEQFPYIHHFDWVIRSTNSFPHSSGIASSASSMSALIMALCQVEQDHLGQNLTQEEVLKRASYLSRLASGSASRSVYPYLAQWGAHPDIPGSSDEYAIPMAHILHDSFKEFHDDILIVDAGEKSVSSTAGHELMETNPFAQVRYQQAADHTLNIIEAMKSGDMEKFIQIVESEALTLHALMMCSQPSYMLMRPGTLSAIERIRRFRKETQIPLTFTLDAGPNVHILYPEEYRAACQSFIASELLKLSPTARLIEDQVGAGPKPLM